MYIQIFTPVNADFFEGNLTIQFKRKKKQQTKQGSYFEETTKKYGNY